MSKNKTKSPQEVETILANPQGKTVEELTEIAHILQTQLNEHQKQANHHQRMMIKAQGGLEVVLQMIPKEEVDEMITQEAKINSENGVASDG